MERKVFLLQGFTIEHEGLRTYLVYRLSEGESIDMFGKGMLTANHIDGIVPVMADPGDISNIRYDITDMTELELFLGGGADRKVQTDIFTSVLYSILGTEKYLLDSSMFVMNIKHIYMDRRSGTLRLIYLPVKHVRPKHGINERIRLLFRDIIFTTRYPCNEDNNYVAGLINELNGTSEFSPSEFLRSLKRPKGVKRADSVQDIIKAQDTAQAAARKYDTASKDVNVTKEVIYEYDTEADSELPYVYSETSDSNNLYSDNVSDNSNKKDSVFGHLKKMFFSKSDSKSENDSTDEDRSDADYYTAGSIPEIKQGADTKNDDGMYFGRLSEINEVREADGLPYLIRSSNGDKVIIDREIFRLGKDAKSSHYRIADNVAVSASHAEIVERNGRFYVSDMDSLNYTYVNGEKLDVRTPKELLSGDVICLADEEFVFSC